jgi:hypothetical protein
VITIGSKIIALTQRQKAQHAHTTGLIITNPAIADHTGNSGVFRFDAEYNLNYNSTIAVSDHYPVYAELWGNRDTD